MRPAAARSVVLLGPVPPWRSGIADQTVRLARALTRVGARPVVFTFRRMYPGLLYPGARDKGDGAFPTDVDVRPLLDGARPLSFRRAALEAAALEPGLVVVPWWTAWWAPHDVLFLKTLGERSNAVKLLLCHNVVDHEGGALKRTLAREVFRRADRLTAPNREAKGVLQREAPGRPVEVLLHPCEAVEVLPERERARAQLGVPEDAALFLFTGILRPYKGWDVLLAAFGKVRTKEPRALLVFAGEAWGAARALARSTPPEGVRLELRYLGEEERAAWLAACDAVVCPYRAASGSGVAADAFAHARPVIGSNVPGLEDVVEAGVNGLLVAPGDENALARAMLGFLSPGVSERLVGGVLATRGRFAPDEHARKVLAFGA
jgi:glycosyltransferase involved in cell wall biosynthesis